MATTREGEQDILNGNSQIFYYIMRTIVLYNEPNIEFLGLLTCIRDFQMNIILYVSIREIMDLDFLFYYFMFEGFEPKLYIREAPTHCNGCWRIG